MIGDCRECGHDLFRHYSSCSRWRESGPEGRAEAERTAGRSGDHSPTPDATTAAGSKSSANLKEAP